MSLTSATTSLCVFVFTSDGEYVTSLSERSEGGRLQSATLC